MRETRWLKRLRGWAMFRGSSRAIGWVIVARSGRRKQIVARTLDGKVWLRAPTVDAAKRWCEMMPPVGWRHLIDENIAILVRPDGVVEERAIERTAYLEMLWQKPRSWSGNLADDWVERVYLTGKVYGLRWADPNSGSYVEWRIMSYAQPAQQDIAARLATTRLENQRRLFQELVFKEQYHQEKHQWP